MPSSSSTSRTSPNATRSTGAANRRMFQLALERILQAPRGERRPDQVTAVLFLDLDDFKVVNDTQQYDT